MILRLELRRLGPLWRGRPRYIVWSCANNFPPDMHVIICVCVCVVCVCLCACVQLDFCSALVRLKWDDL